jgi:hypothetical protein
MNAVTHANLRLMAAARLRTGDPVTDADQQTSMADLRAAVCIEAGVAIGDISPLGYDHSDRGYSSVRASWVRHIGQWGITLFDEHAEEAFALWQKARPDLAEGDDWREAGAQAHKDAYPDGGCFYGDRCVICSPVPEEWL